MILTLDDIKGDWKQAIGNTVNADCLDVMKLIPDKAIDLVLTDPPYGIRADKMTMGRGSRTDKGLNIDENWDFKTPRQEYFDEILRISKNQIIWGGNYFNLTPTRCFLLWDKKDYNSDFASHELAWTSFDKVAKCFQQARNVGEWKRHPTQKPLELMRWCLENYSKSNQLIFDGFLGSGTTSRACKDLGRSFIGVEQSLKYCEIAEKRLEQEILF